MNAYCSVAEFENHPTGLDTQNLVENGSSAQQTAELQLLLQQASSMVDQWVYQPLYAHLQTETWRGRPDAYERVRVRTRHWPIAQVTALQWRAFLSQPWQALDPTTAQVFSAESSGHEIWLGEGTFLGFGGWGAPPVLVQVTYVAGYANAQLTANAAAGTTTLTVDTTLGMTANQALTLYDGVNQETVIVASASGTTVTLQAPTLYAHTAGVRVSAVPDAVTLATIYATAWIIKERRAGAGLMMSGKVQPTNLQASEDMQFFRQLLQPFRRVI